MTTGKTIGLTRRTFVGKVMSLLLNMLFRLGITFLPRNKRLLISWLQSPSADSESDSCSVLSDSLTPHGLYSPPNSPGQNTGLGSRSLLSGIFPTQGSNPGLPRCRQILYRLNHQVWVPINKHRWHNHREKNLFANWGITQWLQTLH